jgi:hypothetical protein
VKGLTINLATRPFRNNAVHWIALATFTLLLSGYSWYNVRAYNAAGGSLAELTQKLKEQREEFDALNAEVGNMTTTVARMDLKTLNDRGSFANGIILGRLFSWTSLFDRLEKIQPEDVRLRSVRPTISREGIEVAVDGVSRDYSGILKFEEALLDSDYFSFVYPQQESSRESSGNEIHFNLAFGYVPEGKNAAEKARSGGPAEGTGMASTDPNAGPAASDPNAAAPADPNAEPEAEEGTTGDDGTEEGGGRPPSSDHGGGR